MGTRVMMSLVRRERSRRMCAHPGQSLGMFRSALFLAAVAQLVACGHLGEGDAGPVNVSGDVPLTMATRTSLSAIPGHPVVAAGTLADLQQYVEALGGRFGSQPEAAVNADRAGKSAFLGLDLTTKSVCDSVTDLQTHLDRRQKLLDLHATISRVCLMSSGAEDRGPASSL